MSLSFVIGSIFGVAEQGSVWQLVGVAPMFVWELALGLWMTFKGFDPSAPILAATAAQAMSPIAAATATPSRAAVVRKAGAA